MPALVIKTFNVQVVEEDILLEIIFCNTQNDTYFLEKRFVFKPNDRYLDGIKITKNGEEISYLGIRRKMRPSKLPDDYFAIEPKSCITSNIVLNDFFDFKQNQEYLINYGIRNANRISNKSDVIEYEVKITT